MLFRKLREQAAVATGDFAKLFGALEVPPLPAVAVRILEMAQDEQAEIAEMAKVIGSDAGIASKILKTVNSSFFGIPRKVEDLQQAVSLLGLKRIHTMALAYAAVDTLTVKAAGFDPAAFWKDSLARAAFAQALAGALHLSEPGVAFTGGLLQNLALPILFSRWGEHYRPVSEMAGSAGRPLQEVEEEHLSWTHAQAGAWIARNWGFPDVLVCCVGLHHAPLEDLDGLELSGSPVIPVAVSSRYPDVDSLCAGLGMDETAIAALRETADGLVGDLAKLLGI